MGCVSINTTPYRPVLNDKITKNHYMVIVHIDPVSGEEKEYRISALDWYKGVADLQREVKIKNYKNNRDS